jgi:ribosomal protein S18 acetylase RimI-like enzyme
MPELSEVQAHHFTHLDGINRFALVALHPADPEEIIAVVRFDREPRTDHAEYAAVVDDCWQGRGIGLALTRHLIEAARRRGVRTFTALVLPDNVRKLALLRDLGLPERIHFGTDVERIEIDL